MLQDLINYIGASAIVIIAVALIGYAKDFVSAKIKSAPTAKERKLWSASESALSALDMIGKNAVAYLDKQDAPSNSEKQAYAQAKLQAYANKHNIPVSTEYLHGIIESQVNDLRAKQQSKGTQSVTITDKGDDANA